MKIKKKKLRFPPFLLTTIHQSILSKLDRYKIKQYIHTIIQTIKKYPSRSKNKFRSKIRFPRANPVQPLLFKLLNARVSALWRLPADEGREIRLQGLWIKARSMHFRSHANDPNTGSTTMAHRHCVARTTRIRLRCFLCFSHFILQVPLDTRRMRKERSRIPENRLPRPSIERVLERNQFE